MDRKMKMAAAALAGLAMGGCASQAHVNQSRRAQPTAAEAKGECFGVNACKGQGACGGAGTECAGTNACKGQGWLSLTKAECDGKNGKFKAS